MGTMTIYFDISDEDQARLDELVEYFGNGDRSVYPRVTLKIMDDLRRGLEACGPGQWETP